MNNCKEGILNFVEVKFLEYFTPRPPKKKQRLWECLISVEVLFSKCLDVGGNVITDKVSSGNCESCLRVVEECNRFNRGG